ncbi:polyprenyl synthetase family protein [Apibacter muscae]|uniref:polyprenyl synthetase family protein n=1 Tax=Apibacter muscae TaxID=2509004 RepID=UPI0011ABA352|nr:polyprenyl synthetase family protein [Apibacter muscae]TWP24435.1 polyprenyl synthetase family protein [Apibacter muscae]
MSKIAEQIKIPIAEEMLLFEKRFYQSMKSKVPLLDRITQFIVRRKGKQMRPMFVFLTAKLTGEISDKTYRAASLIELIHTATLVHDDVVDESYMRRGFFSINALWKNKIAVLVGDYLLSKSVLLATDNKDFDLLSIISRVIRDMAEGELLQLEKSRKLDITEEVYFNIIKQKTAVLISACCESGACSTNADDETIHKLRLFGEYTGIAFQIKDDLFDYNSKSFIGKPVGIDIKERKMTLPLIYAINNADTTKKKWLLNSIKNHNKDKKRISEIIAYVIESGGLKYATSQMNEYKEKALNILYSFPKNSSRDSLELLLNYVIHRNS